MKYIFLEKKDGVFQYKPENNHLIFNGKSEIIIDEIVIVNGVRDDFFTLDDNIFLNKDNKCFVFNYEGKIQFIFENQNAISKSKDNVFLVDALSNNQLYYFNRYKKGVLKTIENYNWELTFINKGILFLYINSILKSINLEAGTHNWETDLGVYISSVLGVFDNKLWIYTGTNELISLALDTGQILQQIRSNDLHSSVSDANLVAYAVHFEEAHGRLTFLKERDYLEFDLATCQVTRQKSFDTGNPQTDWAFSVSSLDGDYCYFVGNQGRDSGFAQWVGVLSRTTLEVEWSEHLGKYNPRNYWALNKAPLSDDNKLYVHDSEGTLHIFEKEEDN